MSKGKNTKRAEKPKKPTTSRRTSEPRPRATSRLSRDDEPEVTKFGDQFLAGQAANDAAPPIVVDDRRVLVWVRPASLPIVLVDDGNGGIVAHRAWLEPGNAQSGFHIGPPYPVDDVERRDDPATLWHAKVELAAAPSSSPDLELLNKMAEDQGRADASRAPADTTSRRPGIDIEDSDEPVRCAEPGCPRSYVGEKIDGWHLFVSATTGLPVAHCHTHAKTGERMLAAQVSAKAASMRSASVERAEQLHREHRSVSTAVMPGAHGAPKLDDAPARAFEETIAAIDRAVERANVAANPLAIPPGGYETPATEKPKRTRKAKFVAGNPLGEETFPFPCAEKHNGCLTTYMAPMRTADVLAGVPDPGPGWWVVEENADGGGEFRRFAYCPSHRAIGEARTAAQNPKVLDDFLPELDAAPPPWDAPAVVVEERAPWE